MQLQVHRSLICSGATLTGKLARDRLTSHPLRAPQPQVAILVRPPPSLPIRDRMAADTGAALPPAFADVRRATYGLTQLMWQARMDERVITHYITPAPEGVGLETIADFASPYTDTEYEAALKGDC